MPASDIRALFVATAAINSLVAKSGRFSGIYTDHLPQGAALANIVITDMGADENPTLENTGGLIFTDVEIDCRARTPEARKVLAKAVNDFFRDFSGTAGNTAIEAVVFADRTEQYEQPEDGSDAGTYVTILEYQVQHRE